MSSDAPIGGRPAQNRVTPLGDIQAFPLRGAFTGNRGILHSEREIVRFHAHNSWVTCALQFNGRWREQWLPRRFTWLYFHDEAVALAAGHRPCAECRRRSYEAYRDAWTAALPGARPSAQQMNSQLHAERLIRGTHQRRLHVSRWRYLSPGVFVLHDARPWLVTNERLTAWSTVGYGATEPRPRTGQVTVITPPSSVAVLSAGYPVQIDASALTPLNR
jgi:hypothetical protein